jgi:hypothetical protein
MTLHQLIQLKANQNKSLKGKIIDVIKIRDSRDIPNTNVVWDVLPQDSSSRNISQGKITNISNTKYRSKNTIVHDTSAMRLENSQEIKNLFSTLGPGQYRKHNKTDSLKPRGDFNTVKHNRSKNNNEKAQEVAHAYK